MFRTHGLIHASLFSLVLLFLLPMSGAAVAAPAGPRLEVGILPAALHAAQFGRHQDYLREAAAARQHNAMLPSGKWVLISQPVLKYNVPALAASIGFDFAQKLVKVGMDFTVVSQSAGLDQIYLVAVEELSGGDMTVSDAAGPLTVENVGQGVRSVTLRQPLAEGKSVALAMKWQGKPTCSGMCSLSSSMTYNLYTSWLPILYDLSWSSSEGGVIYPSTSTLTMTLPAPLVAAASGELISSKLNADGTTTFQFQDKRDGRFNIAIAPYTLDTTPGTTPLVRSYLRAPLVSKGAGWRQAASEILAFHIQQFGSYDFTKADLVEVSDSMLAGGAGGVAGMSLVFLPSTSFGEESSDWRNRQTLAHELAHQWFGMMIQTHDHNSPWLSEGLATFAESEYTAAAATKAGAAVGPHIRRFNGLVYQTAVRGGGDAALSSAAIAKAPSTVYVAVTYYKGALVAGMLKYIVGDAAFQAGLAAYKKEHADDGSVTALLESLKQASGKDLTGFANKWIYDTGYPTYQVSVNRAAGKPVEVVLDSGTDFGLPVDLELLTTDGQVRRQKLTPIGAKAAYSAQAGVEVLQIRPDPDARILGRFVPALSGDVQMSGEVDGIDLITEAWAVGQKFSMADMADPYKAAPFAEWADLISDGTIDQKDLDLVLGSFGKTQN